MTFVKLSRLRAFRCFSSVDSLSKSPTLIPTSTIPESGTIAGQEVINPQNAVSVLSLAVWVSDVVSSLRRLASSGEATNMHRSDLSVFIPLLC